MKGPNYRQRLALLALASAAGGLLLVVRVFSLQVVEHDDWTALALRQQSGWQPVRARRGLIRDHAGRVLAYDAPGFELAVLALGWRATRYECLHCGAAHFVREKKIPARCRRCRLRRLDDKKRPRIVERDHRDLRAMARLLRMREEDLRADVEKRVRQVEARIKHKLKNLQGKRRAIQERAYWHDYGRRPKRLRRDVPYKVARAVALHPEKYPAFKILTSHSRQYPGGAAFAHLLGRTGEAKDRFLVQREDGDTRTMVGTVGRTGIEFHFDKALRGAPGWVATERDYQRRTDKIVDERPARTGASIRLTMVSEDQSRALLALQNATGAFVVVHAQTGAVLAMASAPSYKPHDYAATCEDWNRRCEQLGKKWIFGSPIQERAFRSAHVPGSILKPFTGLAALACGDCAAAETIVCEKVFSYGGKRYNRFLACNGLHGDVDLHRAIVDSCNVYFQTLMARMLEHENFPRFEETGRRFGFGERTGIEIQRRDWAPGNWEFRSIRHSGTLIASAIGQGQVMLSPAQMARAYAGLLTGRLPRLHVVAQVGERTTQPSSEPLGIPADRLERIRRALRGVSTANRGVQKYGLGRFEIACKTGTAQLAGRGNKLYNAWMAGFAPARKGRPPIAVAIVVQRANVSGAESCGPRLAEFFQYFYEGRRE